MYRGLVLASYMATCWTRSCATSPAFWKLPTSLGSHAMLTWRRVAGLWATSLRATVHRIPMYAEHFPPHGEGGRISSNMMVTERLGIPSLESQTHRLHCCCRYTRCVDHAPQLQRPQAMRDALPSTGLGRRLLHAHPLLPSHLPRVSNILTTHPHTNLESEQGLCLKLTIAVSRRRALRQNAATTPRESGPHSAT
jgi:hypothetical protein